MKVLPPGGTGATNARTYVRGSGAIIIASDQRLDNEARKKAAHSALAATPRARGGLFYEALRFAGRATSRRRDRAACWLASQQQKRLLLARTMNALHTSFASVLDSTSMMQLSSTAPRGLAALEAAAGAMLTAAPAGAAANTPAPAAFPTYAAGAAADGTDAAMHTHIVTSQLHEHSGDAAAAAAGYYDGSMAAAAAAQQLQALLPATAKPSTAAATALILAPETTQFRPENANENDLFIQHMSTAAVSAAGVEEEKEEDKKQPLLQLPDEAAPHLDLLPSGAAAVEAPKAAAAAAPSAALASAAPHRAAAAAAAAPPPPPLPLLLTLQQQQQQQHQQVGSSSSSLPHSPIFLHTNPAQPNSCAWCRTSSTSGCWRRGWEVGDSGSGLCVNLCNK